MGQIDELFNQCVKTDAAGTLSDEFQDTHSTEFVSNVILCKDDQEYLDFTAKFKHEHECVFDIGYSMIKNDKDSLGILADVREFINSFAQFCRMRLKAPISVYIRPYEGTDKKVDTFVYITTFIDTKRNISKMLTILSDIRSMQQHILRPENTKCLDMNTSPILNGHSMSIKLCEQMTPKGTKPYNTGRSIALDSANRFIDNVYEIRYANDDYLRERSLKTGDFNYTIDMVSDELKESGIFGIYKKPIEREVRQWFRKARLWKLEYRR